MNDQQEIPLRLAERSLHGARGLAFKPWSGILARGKKPLALVFALLIGWALSQLPAPSGLEKSGLLFLATLATGVILWIFEVFDDYVVGLTLLFSWIVLNVVPPETALAGFSHSAWFFAVGALGMGAAVGRSGILRRLALEILRRVPPSRNSHTFIFAASGPVVTALLPEVKARVVILLPLAQAISEALGFRPRSNGSAGLAFLAYVAFTQATFMFLTGSTYCLVAWSTMPEAAQADFGWARWVLAALPAGLVILCSLFAAVNILFPVRATERGRIPPESITGQLKELGPMRAEEWVSLVVITFAVTGWITKPFHGIAEAWVAMGGFLAFLLTGVLDRKNLRNGIDWGIVLFFGVVYGIGEMCSYLNVDRWLFEWLRPVLLALSGHAVAFLILVLLLSYLVRFFLAKSPAIVLLGLILISPAQEIGIHPGVLILTILLGMETWVLPYQNPSYLLAYQSIDGKAFSHAQARKLMVVKFFASLLAILISIPYWRMLGLL